jgi:hypothetical protein
MNNVVFLIEQWATGLYIIFGAIIALQIWRWNRARESLRSTQFELERDLARYSRSNALTTLLLLVEAILFVVAIQVVVAPTIRRTSGVDAAILLPRDDGVFRTPTPAPLEGQFTIDSSGVQLGEVNPANQILPTPTLTPTFVGTIVPNSPPPIGCDQPGATLQIPANGMIVFEPIVVRGTAFSDEFAFYKFELNGPATFGNFAPLPVDGTQAVQELGDLGQFVPAFYQPGEYRFRVVVFDTSNRARASCEITIFISDPIPTPTPLGTVAP